MPLRYGWRRTIGTAARYLLLRAAGYSAAVNLEVSRRCNARCDFCRYPRVREDPRLDNYLPIVKRLKPTLLTLSGGEPLLRKDLERLIAWIRAGCPNLHIGLVTNGSLLTVERGPSLWRAGVDQLALETVVKAENLNEVPRIVEWA